MEGIVGGHVWPVEPIEGVVAEFAMLNDTLEFHVVIGVHFVDEPLRLGTLSPDQAEEVAHGLLRAADEARRRGAGL